MLLKPSILKAAAAFGTVLLGWTLLQVAFWKSRESIEGSAWVALLEHAYPPESKEYLPDCVRVPPKLLEATPARYRQRAERLLDTLAVPLVVMHQTEIPDDGCVTLWVPSDVRSSGDFAFPLFGRSTVAYFYGDSNGDRVLMSFAFGRWHYLRSWNAWM